MRLPMILLSAVAAHGALADPTGAIVPELDCNQVTLVSMGDCGDAEAGAWLTLFTDNWGLSEDGVQVPDPVPTTFSSLTDRILELDQEGLIGQFEWVHSDAIGWLWHVGFVYFTDRPLSEFVTLCEAETTCALVEVIAADGQLLLMTVDSVIQESPHFETKGLIIDAGALLEQATDAQTSEAISECLARVIISVAYTGHIGSEFDWSACLESVE